MEESVYGILARRNEWMGDMLHSTSYGSYTPMSEVGQQKHGDHPFD